MSDQTIIYSSISVPDPNGNQKIRFSFYPVLDSKCDGPDFKVPVAYSMIRNGAKGSALDPALPDLFDSCRGSFAPNGKTLSEINRVFNNLKKGDLVPFLFFMEEE